MNEASLIAYDCGELQKKIELKVVNMDMSKAA
jgi:hypothetical protein